MVVIALGPFGQNVTIEENSIDNDNNGASKGAFAFAQRHILKRNELPKLQSELESRVYAWLLLLPGRFRIGYALALS